jgi:hypothetical protein
MDENTRKIESLFTSATEYAKTSLELVKLKTLDKTADIVSSAVPNSIFIILAATFLLFLNIGIALWLGEVFGKASLGFFAVAAFYIVIGLLVHFFMHKRIKRRTGNYFIKCMLK